MGMDQLYRVLARSLPGMTVFLYDRDLRYLIVEGESLDYYGYTPQMFEGRTVYEMLSAPEQDLLLPHYRAALEGEISEFEGGFDDHIFHMRFLPVREDDGEIVAGMLISRTVTGARQMEYELSRRVQQLTILHEVEAELDDQLNVDYVLTMALDAALRLSEGEAGYIALVEETPDGRALRLSRIVGGYPEKALREVLNSGSGIVGRVLRTQTAEFISDVAHDPDHTPFIPRTVSRIVIPLISQDLILGILNLETDRPGIFNEEIFEFLKLMTARIAVAVDNARLYRQAEEQLAELKRLYHQVRKLEQLKTDMIRIASHDLRNPLAAVMGFLEMSHRHMKSNGLVDPTLTGYVDEAMNSSLRMRKIMTDILSLERIEMAAENTNFEKFDLARLVNETFQDHQSLAKVKSQALSLETEPASAVIEGDSAQMREAIGNLISNAIKYTPDGGKICVRLAQQPRCLVFTVEDNGYGIKESHQARLFQPFYRARSPETRDVEGTGLGLHLVKNIIERHGGTMIFKSVYQQGSTFGFELPTG